MYSIKWCVKPFFNFQRTITKLTEVACQRKTTRYTKMYLNTKEPTTVAKTKDKVGFGEKNMFLFVRHHAVAMKPLPLYDKQIKSYK